MRVIFGTYKRKVGLVAPNLFAENLVKDIIDAVEGLSHNPEKYRPIDEEPWGSQGVRKIHYQMELFWGLILYPGAKIMITGYNIIISDAVRPFTGDTNCNTVLISTTTVIPPHGPIPILIISVSSAS